VAENVSLLFWGLTAIPKAHSWIKRVTLRWGKGNKGKKEKRGENTPPN